MHVAPVPPSKPEMTAFSVVVFALFSFGIKALNEKPFRNWKPSDLFFFFKYKIYFSVC